MGLIVYMVCADEDHIFDAFQPVLEANYFELLHKQIFKRADVPVTLPRDSAGGKVMFAVAYDVESRPEASSTYGVDNRNVLALMAKLRAISGGFSCYATRTEKIAWKIIRKLTPELAHDVRGKIAQKQNEYDTASDIFVRRFENSARRSKVELVRQDGKLFVKKTYRRSAIDFMNREIRAREVLDHPAVSPIVERGDNYIVIPYYEDARPWRDNGIRLYPLDRARDFFCFVSWLSQSGYVMLDWNPGAVIFDRVQGMKVMDFEYFSDAPGKPANFENSFDFQESRVADDEFLSTYKIGSYGATWYPLLGVQYDEVLGGVTAKIRVKRALHVVFKRLPRFAVRKTWDALRALRPMGMRRYKSIGEYIEYEK